MHEAGLRCAGSFEWVETMVDGSGGSKQQYVEDCQVRCQPNVLAVGWNSRAQAYAISAELESYFFLGLAGGLDRSGWAARGRSEEAGGCGSVEGNAEGAVAQRA